MTFDGINPGCNPAENGSRISRSRTHLENPVSGFDLGCLNHHRHDERLRDGLLLSNGKRRILVGECLKARIEEDFARYERLASSAPITDAASGDLELDHAVALA